MFDIFNPLQNIEPRFTPEQRDILIEWFDENSSPLLLVNGEPVNVVRVEQLQEFLALKKFHKRSFRFPSYGDIMKVAEELKAGVTKMLTKDQVIYMLDKWLILPELKHELKLAFKVFDTEKRDFLEMEELQSIVTTYGNVLNKEETLEMLRDANVRGDGNIFYEDFVESLFNVAPELYEIKAEYLYEDPNEDPSVPPDPIIEAPSPEKSSSVKVTPAAGAKKSK